MKSTIIFVAVVVLCIFGILIAFAGTDPVGDIPLRLNYQPPLEAPAALDDLAWLSQKRGILKRFFAEEMKEIADDINDPAKMRQGLATSKSGQPVGSIGVLLGLAISELVKRLIYLLIISILTALVLSWLKAHILQALLILVFPFVVVFLISWITARNVARGILEKKTCVT